MRTRLGFLIGGVLAPLGLLAAGAEPDLAERLREALTFHASFDEGYEADFARGDPRLFTAPAAEEGEPRPGIHREGLRLTRERARWGRALQFLDEEEPIVAYRALDNVAYRQEGWSGTLSFWLGTDMVDELAPGFADPVMLTDKQWNDAALFVDFTREEPRVFRVGVFSDLSVWNPDGLPWDEVEEAQRPFIDVEDPPFTGRRLVHVAVTWEGYNRPEEPAVTRLYLDGELAGERRHRERFTWDMEQASIRLGISFLGVLDDLALFDRALKPEEVRFLHGLEGGVGRLHAGG